MPRSFQQLSGVPFEQWEPEELQDWLTNVKGSKGGLNDQREKATGILRQKLRAREDAAAAAAHEHKLSRGPSPREAVVNDVIARLRKMGIPDNSLRTAESAYYNLVDAYGNNANLTPEELITELKSRDYSEAEISRMAPFFDKIKPVVEADLGISDPTATFPDEVSRRNYLIANHFSDAEIKKAEQDAQRLDYRAINRMEDKPGSSTWIQSQFKLPKEAQDRLFEQDAKHQAGRVKRSAVHENARIIKNLVQDYNEHTMPGTSQEKHAMELGSFGSHLLAHAANQGAFKYKGPRLADVTEEEKQAENLIKSNSPYDKAEQERQKTLTEVNQRNFGKNAIQKAAEPYMSKASADFAKRHQEMFGDIETAHEKSLYDQGLRNWQEKIAPTIKAKYLTPGVRGHGHVKKEVEEAAENTMRGVIEAIIGQRAQNRAASMGAALQEQANQAKLAGQAGALSQADIDADLKATEALEGIHGRHEAEKLQHAMRIGAIGENKGAREQSEINAKIREAEAEHAHAERFGRTLSDVANQNPVSEFRKEEPLEKPKRTGIQSTAAGFMGAGANMFGGQGKKAGGRIKRATGGTVTPIAHAEYVTPHAMIGYLQAKNAHQRLAEGGAVNPNFIQDAVFDGVLPSTELRQQVRRQVLDQAKEDYDNKPRNFLATGGTVEMFANAKMAPREKPRAAAPLPANPIMAGANMAESFVEDKRDKEIRDKVHEERMRIMNPVPEKEESLLSRAVKGFMAGAASTGNNDWVARSGKAFTAADQANEAKREERRKREAERQKLMLEVGHEYTNERNAEKTHGLAEQAHELAKRKQAHDESMGEAQRGDFEAKRKYYEAHGNLYTAQAEKLRGGYGLNGEHPDEMPTKPQTKETQKKIDKAKDLIASAQIAAGHLDLLQKDLLNMNGGPASSFISSIPSLGAGNAIGAWMAGTDSATMAAANSDAAAAISSILGLENKRGERNAGRVASTANTAIEGKPGKSLPQSKNIPKLRNYRNEIYIDLDFAVDMLKDAGASRADIAKAQKAVDEQKEQMAYLEELAKANPDPDAQFAGIPEVEKQAKLAALKARRDELQKQRGAA